MSEKDGGQAFPQNQHGTPKDGMTLRDYFAAAALRGIVSAFADDKARQMTCDNATDAGRHPKEQVALAAYKYADAMLKAREAK
jgi:hypothetical protein